MIQDLEIFSCFYYQCKPRIYLQFIDDLHIGDLDRPPNYNLLKTFGTERDHFCRILSLFNVIEWIFPKPENRNKGASAWHGVTRIFEVQRGIFGEKEEEWAFLSKSSIVTFIPQLHGWIPWTTYRKYYDQRALTISRNASVGKGESPVAAGDIWFNVRALFAKYCVNSCVGHCLKGHVL